MRLQNSDLGEAVTRFAWDVQPSANFSNPRWSVSTTNALIGPSNLMEGLLQRWLSAILTVRRSYEIVGTYPAYYNCITGWNKFAPSSQFVSRGTAECLVILTENSRFESRQHILTGRIAYSNSNWRIDSSILGSTYREEWSCLVIQIHG
jgi:hypothetical protein